MNDPQILISGKYSAFDEGWNAAGVYMISGKYESQTFSQPIYIGSSVDIKRRVTLNHLPELRNNIHTNDPLQFSFNKYGEDNFVVWCLER